MKAIYQNLVTMMQILVNWALSPQKVTTTNQVGVFKQGILALQSKLQSITNLNQLLNLTGIALDKKTLRLILTQGLLNICKPVKAYAIATSNDELRQKVSKSKSALNQMSALNLIAFATTVINAVTTAIIADMQTAGYAVSDADMTSLASSKDAFNSSITAPKQAIGDKKALNENVNTLVKEANAICHNVLDENIISFETINTNYVEEYYIKRQITPTGIHHNRANITVVNDVNEPFIGAIVTVNEFSKDGKIFTAKSAQTDIKGNAIVSGFESGIRTITVSGTTVTTKTFGPFQFVNGKTITQTFTCAPAVSLPASTKTTTTTTETAPTTR